MRSVLLVGLAAAVVGGGVLATSVALKDRTSSFAASPEVVAGVTSNPGPVERPATTVHAPMPTTTRTVTPQAAPRTVTVTPAPTTTTKTVTVQPSSPEVSDRQPAGPPSIADTGIDAETASAVVVVEDYWKDIFTGWDVTWVSPRRYNGDGFYDSRSGVAPYCGTERLSMNGGYCPLGVGVGFVSWDRPFMEANFYRSGDAFIYLLVAHEWAHAAQERFVADGQEPAVVAQYELQADCLAGATLAGAEKLGVLTMEPGDSTELINALIAAGDDHPWTGGNDHGSSAERVHWFDAGFNGDIETCLGNRS
jgi:predicted metalloprotease